MGVPTRKRRCLFIPVTALLHVLFSLLSWRLCVAASVIDAERAVLDVLPPAALEAEGDVSRRVDLSHKTAERDHLHVRLLYPEQGEPTPSATLFRCHVRRHFELLTEVEALFYHKASACRVCVEVDGRSPPVLCMLPKIHNLKHASFIQEQITPVYTLPPGNHSARCFVRCGLSSPRNVRIESDSVSFTVVLDAELAASRALKQRNVELQSGTLTLVIGVKTNMQWGFALRQAIRETWASPSSLPPGVRVVFLGCRAPPETRDDRFTYGIELERRAHGDLLIDELEECEDSYDGLVGKVTAFIRYVTTRFATSAPIVMVTDDDVYIDVRRLLQHVHMHLPSNRECVYAGQVWEKQFNRLIEPVRDPTRKYYVSEQAYPIKYWPPFAFGPHYLLSWECLGLILDNQRLVGEFRGLDDITVAVWLLASGVHPHHVPHFKNLRDLLCLNTDDSIISLADVSTTALHAIHDNLQSGRPFCHGADLSVWLR
jgi:hypothetical protein